MPLYRCASDAEFAGVNLPWATRRAPGNVPYVADNIWDWLRPPSMPSRRTAVYASPSVELARAGAAAPGVDTQAKRVGRVAASGGVHAVQCPQRDARDHPDVGKVGRSIMKYLGRGWTSLPVGAKQPLGLLFVPVLDASEVNDLLSSVPELAEELRAISTFWSDVRSASLTKQLPFPDGEVFFSAAEGYRLEEANSEEAQA